MKNAYKSFIGKSDRKIITKEILNKVRGCGFDSSGFFCSDFPTKRKEKNRTNHIRSKLQT
jgi:hypothetical protein